MASFEQSLYLDSLSFKDLVALTYTDKATAAVARKRLNAIWYAFHDAHVQLDLRVYEDLPEEWFVRSADAYPAVLGESPANMEYLEDVEGELAKMDVAPLIPETHLARRIPANPGRLMRGGDRSIHIWVSGLCGRDSNSFYDIARIMASNRTVSLGLPNLAKLRSLHLLPPDERKRTFQCSYIRGEQDGRTVKLRDDDVASVLRGIPTYVTIRKAEDKEGLVTYVAIGRPIL